MLSMSLARAKTDSIAAVIAETQNAGQAAARAVRPCVSLAQLLFGVIATAPSDPFVYQVERAAVAAMRRSDALGFSSALVDEAELTMRGRGADDLRVEVAGLLSRMMIDRNTFVILENLGQRYRYVQFATSDDGDLRVESVGDTDVGEGDELSERDHVLLLSSAGSRLTTILPGNATTHAQLAGSRHAGGRSRNACADPDRSPRVC